VSPSFFPAFENLSLQWLDAFTYFFQVQWSLPGRLVRQIVADPAAEIPGERWEIQLADSPVAGIVVDGQGAGEPNSNIAEIRFRGFGSDRDAKIFGVVPAILKLKDAFGIVIERKLN
jgi:hypothetical protein